MTDRQTLQHVHVNSTDRCKYINQSINQSIMAIERNAHSHSYTRSHEQLTHMNGISSQSSLLPSKSPA